jgi:hypothetical protein
VGLENHEDTILGAAADFLFTRSADGFGEEREFKIYDTTTGKLVYRARYQETQDFLVSSAPNTLSLEYFGRVRLYCDLSQQKSACWRKTLVINQIPLAVELRPPDCAPVYQTAEFKARPQLVHEPAAVQLFIQVRVEDIRHPVVTYLGSQVSCIAAP